MIAANLLLFRKVLMLGNRSYFNEENILRAAYTYIEFKGLLYALADSAFTNEVNMKQFANELMADTIAASMISKLTCR